MAHESALKPPKEATQAPPATTERVSDPLSTEEAAALRESLGLGSKGEDIAEQVRELNALDSPRTLASLGTPTFSPNVVVRLPIPFEIDPEGRIDPSNGSSSPPPPLAGPPVLPRSGTAAPPISLTRSARPAPLPSAPPLPSIPPPPRPFESQKPPPPADRTQAKPATGSEAIDPAALLELLQARRGKLEKTRDAVGLARVHIELAVVQEVLFGNDNEAVQNAEAAIKADPKGAPAHSFLRRRKHNKAALPAMLAHIEFEIAASSSDGATVELLADKGRLLEAMEDRGDAARSAWQQVLARSPLYPAALKGLEVNLVTRARDDKATSYDSLATHLSQMADAYSDDVGLAAWLHVERARLLEYKLKRVDAARGALERALIVDPRVGPVRNALVRHVSAHRDFPALATLLDEEATLETDDSRAARLELDAACILCMRLGDAPRAITLLERAAKRAPTDPAIDRMVLDELVRLRESAAHWEAAVTARRALLRYITEPAALAFELRGLAMTEQTLGNLPGGDFGCATCTRA